MEKIALYAHGGSMNHGCEAITRSLIKILGLTKNDILISNAPNEDKLYNLDKIITIKNCESRVKTNWFNKIIAKLSGDPDKCFYQNKYKQLTNLVTNCSVALSIGGDNYCYRGMDKEMMIMRQLIEKAGIPQILIGCSIELDKLSSEIINDLHHYKFIYTRESLTYNSLLHNGFKNVKIFPDSAFLLDRRDLPLPDGFEENNTVGINISPLIINKAFNNSIVFDNYLELIKHIIQNTNLKIALIPHVVWSHNDDRKPLLKIYERFKDSGRIILIEDHNAEELKGYIARCRFMIASRTHASIAAYSQFVPTLVLGYSIKARGIAQDLFGKSDSYVIPVQSLGKKDDLIKAFNWLIEHESDIHNHLKLIIPEYTAKLNNLCL